MEKIPQQIVLKRNRFSFEDAMALSTSKDNPKTEDKDS